MRIRLVQPSDAPVLARLVTDSRAFLAPWEPVRAEEYFTVDGQHAGIEEALVRHTAGAQVPYVILDDDGSVVGRINLNNVVRGVFQSASVGYWLSESAGGRGLASQAVGEVVTEAFGALGLHRLEAGTIPNNIRSQAVLVRNGFSRFGYAPRYLRIAGHWQDHVLYQRLADD